MNWMIMPSEWPDTMPLFPITILTQVKSIQNVHKMSSFFPVQMSEKSWLRNFKRIWCVSVCVWTTVLFFISCSWFYRWFWLALRIWTTFEVIETAHGTAVSPLTLIVTPGWQDLTNNLGGYLNTLFLPRGSLRHGGPRWKDRPWYNAYSLNSPPFLP